MAFGARTVATYDVEFNVDLGRVTSQLGVVGETFGRTTGRMSNDALRLTVAQDRLTKAIARSGPESTAAKAALLAYRREVESLRTTQTAAVSTTARHTSALREEEQQLGKTGRGALAASGIFRGLGRSVAFASGTFLGGYGLVFAIESATKAASQQQVAEGQLETALRNRGQAVDQLRGNLDNLTASNARLGFGELDTTKSLTLAVTATGSLAGATRLLSVAQNVARARGTTLTDATLLLTRAYEGSGRGLKALGVEVAKGAKGFEALDAVQAKYAGRAVAYANSSAGGRARLTAELERTKVTIGNELLPVEVKLATAVANYLGKASNQRKIQHDVNEVVKVGTGVVHDFGVALHLAQTFLGPINRLLGGTEHSVEILAGALVGLKLNGLIQSMKLFGNETAIAGGKATVAAGEYTALAGAEAAAAGGAAAGAGGGGLIGPFGGLAVGAGLTGGVKVGFPLLARLPLISIIPDSRKLPAIPLFDANGKKIGEQRFVSLPKPGAIVTIRGQKYVFVQQGNRVGLLEVTAQGKQTGSKYAGGSPNAQTQVGADSGTFSGSQTGLPNQGKPLDTLSRIQLQLAQAQAAQARGDKGAQAQIVALLKQEADVYRKDEQLQERLMRTDVKHRAAHARTLETLYSEEQSVDAQLAQIASDAAAKTKAASDKKAAAEKKAAAQAAAARKKALEEQKKAVQAEQRDYIAGIALQELRMKNAVAAAKSGSTLEKAQEILLERFYQQQEHNANLTAKQQQTYRAKELALEKKLRQQAKRTTTSATATSANIAAEIKNAIGTLNDIIRNESNVSGPTIHVHQTFPHPPTNDGRREAIMAHHAIQASFA